MTSYKKRTALIIKAVLFFFIIIHHNLFINKTYQFLFRINIINSILNSYLSIRFIIFYTKGL